MEPEQRRGGPQSRLGEVGTEEAQGAHRNAGVLPRGGGRPLEPPPDVGAKHKVREGVSAAAAASATAGICGWAKR